MAVAYAYRHLDEAEDVDIAWLLSAADPTVLQNDFGRLASALEVKDLRADRDAVQAVHAALFYRQGWLLIFDNAADQKSLQELLPTAGHGQILITSQNATDWQHGWVLPVMPFTREDAAAFLMKRTGDPDKPAAEELADQLGGLPLALEQARAYIESSGSGIAGYLTLFQGAPKPLLDKDEPAGYQKTVATTWNLAFNRLAENPESGGTALLRLVAWCAPEPIPIPLLLMRPAGELIERAGPEIADIGPMLSPLLNDQAAINDAIIALRRYSLITIVGEGQVVSVHRLVQLVTRDNVAAELSRQWHKAVAALIEAAIDATYDTPEMERDYALLLPHALQTVADDSPAMARIASYLGSSGSHAAARDRWELIVQALGNRPSGAQNPETLKARLQLARWTGEAGDPEAAREQFEKLVPVLDRAFGPRADETLNARASLAGWTGQAGKAAQARDGFQGLLEDFKEEFGPEARETLEARMELARWTGEAGDPAGARDQFKRLCADAEDVLGAEDRTTLMIRESLAGWTGETGKQSSDRRQLAEARDQFSQLLPIVSHVFGAKHPETLHARASLARWTGEAGKAAAARDQFKNLLPDVQRVLGPAHPDTLNVRANLGHWTGEAGDAKAARQQFEDLLKDIDETKSLGDHHPVRLGARASLARWTGATGNTHAARQQFEEVLPAMRRELGADHPDTRAAERWAARLGVELATSAPLKPTDGYDAFIWPRWRCPSDRSSGRPNRGHACLPTSHSALRSGLHGRAWPGNVQPGPGEGDRHEAHQQATGRGARHCRSGDRACADGAGVNVPQRRGAVRGCAPAGVRQRAPGPARRGLRLGVDSR